ncbi:MAG: NAD(P)/FAD-dependent oxidoreductase [Pirellulaceae bacterium]|nr:NAD(P)/FAD-dependent oxidoreductase [Pirellulaceae bacterium]
MSGKPHFGIVGGGLLGLSLALRLAQRGHRVTLLEGAAQLGGLADAWQLGDITWDRHYHVTLLSDSHLRGLLRELSLDDDMQWVPTRTGFYVAGRLHSLSSSWEFLRFPPLGLIDKLRLGWTIWHASRIRDWERLEQIPVGQWLRKHSGQRTFERIWLPLLKAKLGAAWERTSAAFIWATIQRLYAARRTGLKKEMFGYLPGGYARLLATFREKLLSLGVEIRTGWRVDAIEPTAAGTLEIAAGGERLACDRVVVTVPAPVAAKICPSLSAAELSRLEQVEYLGIVCASLLLARPLAGYYVTNITDEFPFTGVIEMTALVDPTQFGGRHLVYLPKYVAAGDPTFSQSDDELRATSIAALTRMYPDFSASDVLAFRVSRVRHVFALSTLGYSHRVPPVETSLPGLFLVNSAQIVNGTLNVNETVRLAEGSLETLCQSLPQLPLPARTHAPATRELVARSG